MRITALLLLAACLQVSAAGYGQKVSLTETNAPLDKVFRSIKAQTGYTFFYTDDQLREFKPVTLAVDNMPLEEVLDLCFEGQLYTYVLLDKMIVIRKRMATPVDTGRRRTINVKGSVYNESGEPLSGANVTIKETGRGSITNAKGQFVSDAIPVGSTLIFSFIGYSPQQLKISDTASIKIYLKLTKNELDKVVIQAYGTTSQRLTTGNIATVTADDIEKQPVMNPLQALQGRVAGLVVTPDNGYASAPFSVIIRGINSINTAVVSDPLYIIDGVPLTIENVNQNVNYGYGSPSVGFDQGPLGSPAGGQSPFFSLNPNDIESITVLKDADATAIYGSRAANGAIIITTKKGKPGRTKFDLNVYQGESAVTNHWALLNTPQYLEMRREAFANDGITPTTGSAPDLLLWDTTRYTDWQKYLWGGIGNITDAQTSLSGGDAQTTFRIGMGYRYQTSILTVSGSDQRGSVSINLTHHALDHRFIVSFTTGYSYGKSDMVNLPGLVSLPPDAPSVFDSKGNLNYTQWDALAGQGHYPFSGLLQPYSVTTSFLNSNLTLSYQLIKGLSIKASLGYNTSANYQTQFFPIASLDPATSPTGTAQFGSNRNTTWVVEPQIEYNTTVSKAKINVLVGGTSQSTVTDGSSMFGYGYTNDALLRTISNAASFVDNDFYGQYKYAGIFARIGVNWDNRYILNLNARRDGSSRFGPGDQYGNFGSVGAAWILSDEKWITSILPSTISLIKIRGSYGTTGNDGVGDYQYLSRWSANGNVPYQGIAPLVPLQHANPDFHWQVNHKLEAALDIGLWKDRVNLEGAWYRNRCNNQLVSFPTPIFTGFTSVTSNSPADVQNTGLEFLVNAKILDSKQFTWTANFNIAINRNKLLAYPNFSESPYTNTLVIGLPLNIIKLLHYTGVDPQTGQYSFGDKNHDGVINPNPGPTNDLFNYKLDPKFTGGFGTSLRYQNVQLSVFCYYSDRISRNAVYASSFPGTMANQPIVVLQRWQKPGDIAPFAKFTTIPSTTQTDFSSFSDGMYTSGSFLRVSNIALTYNLAAGFIKKMSLQGCRIFINCQNPFVITKYKGLDPEITNFGGMPPAKTIAGGISFNF